MLLNGRELEVVRSLMHFSLILSFPFWPFRALQQNLENVFDGKLKFDRAQARDFSARNP